MPENRSVSGLISALGAYLIWGFNALYFKSLKAVHPMEILMHRMMWSFVLLLLILWCGKRMPAFWAALRQWRTLMLLTVSTLLIGGNWLIFIWAINDNRILDASLGYYICPLVNVMLGAVFLSERLRPMQWAAVGIAAGAVFYLTVFHGQFPWAALGLAVSFGLYGLIRKIAPVEALEGLAVESMLMFPPALGYLLWLNHLGSGAMTRIDLRTDLLLIGTSLVTAVPLLLFNVGARRLNLTTIGFLQYSAPSCTFLLAVFLYREPFTAAQGAAFAAIWTALALYSVDALRQYRHDRAREPRVFCKSAAAKQG